MKIRTLTKHQLFGNILFILLLCGFDAAATNSVNTGGLKKQPARTGSVELFVRLYSKAVSRQSFIGFGAEWDSRGYNAAGVTEKDFEVIYNRLHWMRLPVARVMMQTKWCYRGEGEYDWYNPDMQALYRHLDICQKLGTTVFLADWGCEPGWLRIPGIKDVADPKYAEAIGAYMDHLINQKGYTCIRYFIMVNEPNFEVKNWERWKKGVENVFSVFKKYKLDKKVVFTGSDHSNNDHWHEMAVDQLHHILGAYDIHCYANDRDVRPGKLRDYFRRSWGYALTRDPDAKNKPFIVGEAGMNDGAQHPVGNHNINQFYYGLFMADYAVQAANAGSSAVIAWMLDDNSHPGFFWGMWKNKSNSHELRRWFYPWSLLSRYFPANSVIYRVRRLSKDVRLLAACIPKKGKSGDNAYTFCIVNRAEKSVKVTLKVEADKIVSLRRYIYSKDMAMADENGFPVPVATEQCDLGKGFYMDCPAESVVLLTSVEPESK